MEYVQSEKIIEIIDRFEFLLSEATFISFMKEQGYFSAIDRFIFVSTTDNTNVDEYEYTVQHSIKNGYGKRFYFFTDATANLNSLYKWDSTQWLISFKAENGVITYDSVSNHLQKHLGENSIKTAKGELLISAYGMAIHYGYVADPKKLKQKDIHIAGKEQDKSVPPTLVYEYRNSQKSEMGKILVWGNPIIQKREDEYLYVLGEMNDKKNLFILVLQMDKDDAVISENFRIFNDLDNKPFNFIDVIEKVLKGMMREYKLSKGFDANANICSFKHVDDLKPENYSLINETYVLGKQVAEYGFRNQRMVLMESQNQQGEDEYDVYLVSDNDLWVSYQNPNHSISISKNLRTMIEPRSSKERKQQYAEFTEILIEKGLLKRITF